MERTLSELKQAPLHALHLELGARMLPFAGYVLLAQYKPGLIKEHQLTREQAGPFDVWYMGPLCLGPRRWKVLSRWT